MENNTGKMVLAGNRGESEYVEKMGGCGADGSRIMDANDYAGRRGDWHRTGGNNQQ